MSEDRNRLVDITLDDTSLAPASANAEHERRIALFDLKETNSFAVKGADSGPYTLLLAVVDGRLAFDVADQAGARVCLHHLPLQGVRKFVKDYMMICDSYNNAIRNAAPSQIEAIDMGRRGLHNEAGEALQDALSAWFEIDLETARRLFTLVCALHARG
jgi:uncharacterized protein (UPF0262 family)